MITKNNNFLVKSLTKNLVNNQSQQTNKSIPLKKTGNVFIQVNSNFQEQKSTQAQIPHFLLKKDQLQQEQLLQQRILQERQQQQLEHHQMLQKQERQRILQQQQEQQRILQQQQEQQRILQQQQEQQRILQQQQEQQRMLQEQERILQQQEQERILQQQQEQQRMLQEQERILQQQEQQRILQQQQEPQRIFQQEQEQQRILQQQQQEQQRILQQQQQEQQQKEQEKNAQNSLQLSIFGKNKKTHEMNSIITTLQSAASNNNHNSSNVSSFSSALSDYKTKKTVNKGTLKMDIMNDNDNDPKKMFQDMCQSNASIIPRHLLQNIHLNRENEAILIEFRVLPHVEFIIKNAIVKLGDSFSHTIVCGNDNYSMMKHICDSISPEIKIIKLEKSNVTINDYNNLFYNLSFWEMFYGNKLLFYQEDTVIFKNNINEFLQYDYIGAPWNLEQNPNFPNVGNGGFSLRNRNILMNIVRNKVDVYDTSIIINKKHKSGIVLDNIPEDIFFSLSFVKLRIGNVPHANVASYFSTEIVVNKDSLGGHQFWLNDRSWTDRMNTLFQEYRNG